MSRRRPDRCPGVLRPWPAEDGLLVRLRLPGGRIAATALDALAGVAQEYGDGRVRVTSRANLQVRALPGQPGTSRLRDDVLAALEATGLLPSRPHDVARNVMASPQSGLAGGRADLRPVVVALDEAIRADPLLADLPGRFLFVLDDGRGDLLDREGDLGLVALDAGQGQLRLGNRCGAVILLSEAATVLTGLARDFLTVRGSGPSAPWHVDELARPLDGPLARPHPRDPRFPAPAPSLPFGRVAGGRHEPVPDDGLDRRGVQTLCAAATSLVVTPWRGVLIPEEP